CELDDRYGNEIKWNIIESRITENQIVQFEQKNGVAIPKQFREFLQSYSFLNEGFYAMGIASYESDFQGVYNRKTGDYTAFTDDDMDRDEDLIGEIQLDFFNVNKSIDCMENLYFKNIRMVHLGNLDTGDLLLLDCETGEVQSWDSEQAALEAGSRKDFLEQSPMTGFWFRNFDTFLEWVYGKSIYDVDKADEERERLIEQRRKQRR
ncbi:MAG: SMI1/KNR4 family protein, partial [Lachnospiraceae bacterium]|nr:SMI1/KNR4 family protein [Lachnospiraceae bacterium]